MIIKDINQVHEVLKKYIPEVSKYSGDGMSLDRMWPLLEVVGNPHDQLKVVHVAGTSGKTSTCYYISEILKSSGCLVGMTVSPHVDSITERLQINGECLPEEEFCLLFGEFIDNVDRVKEKPSYFEIMVVFVYWVFERKNVDYAVVETGMGGLLDGSNVARRSDKICVITDVGLDHTHILGNTVKEIATQKSGIIQPGNDVFMNEQSRQIMDVVDAAVSSADGNLYVIQNESSSSALMEGVPLFQVRNWRLASGVCKYISDRDNIVVSSKVSLADIIVPGRMEVLGFANGLLIMDGAHNGQKVQAFVDSFNNLYPGKKAHVMLALKEGKEYEDVLSLLKPLSVSLTVTTFNTSQDLPAQSQDPSIIAAYARDLGFNNVNVAIDSSQALQDLVHMKGIKIVIGSFYLLGQIRPFLTSTVDGV